jgi:Zn-dependent protease
MLMSVPAAFAAVMLRGFTALAALSAAGFRRGKVKPLKFIDPLGIVLLIICGYGWGNSIQPPFVYAAGKRGALAAARALPIIVNIAFGTVCAFAARVSGHFGAFFVITDFFAVMARVNVTFGLFNLIPVHPLDGAGVLTVLLNAEANRRYQEIERVLQCVLVVALAGGFAQMVFDPIAGAIISLVV